MTHKYSWKWPVSNLHFTGYRWSKIRVPRTWPRNTSTENTIICESLIEKLLSRQHNIKLFRNSWINIPCTFEVHVASVTKLLISLAVHFLIKFSQQIGEVWKQRLVTNFWQMNSKLSITSDVYEKALFMMWHGKNKLFSKAVISFKETPKGPNVEVTKWQILKCQTKKLWIHKWHFKSRHFYCFTLLPIGILAFGTWSISHSVHLLFQSLALCCREKHVNW